MENDKIYFDDYLIREIESRFKISPFYSEIDCNI